MQDSSHAFFCFSFDPISANSFHFCKLWKLRECFCKRLRITRGKQFDRVHHLVPATNLADDLNLSIASFPSERIGYRLSKLKRIIQSQLAAFRFDSIERRLDAIDNLLAESGNRGKPSAIGKRFQFVEALDAEVAVEHLRSLQPHARNAAKLKNSFRNFFFERLEVG